MEIKRHYRPERVKKYEARWYVGGRLKCRFFATENEREKFVENFSEQLERNGRDLLLGFDAAKMRRWQEATRLAPEADPVEVVRFWLASSRPVLRPRKLSEAIPAYLKHLKGIERDPEYRKHIKRHLEDFSSSLRGDRHVHEITHQMIANYVLNLPYQAVTKRHYRRDLKGAYSWWIEQEWAMENPVRKVRTPQVIAPEPGILSVEEAERLLRANEHVDPGVCGLLALGLFAGMRSSAIARLAYDELDFKQRGIHTPAEKTKKRRRQWIEDLPDNLWAWLKRTPKEAFAMTQRQYLHRRSEALKRAGLLIEADDIARGKRQREAEGLPPVESKPKCPPKNCFRHSFVTYHVALHRNPGKTALIISHRNQDVMFRHYLGIANKENAERYFDIYPSNKEIK
jgi:integrase